MKIYDLSQPLNQKSPFWPYYPPFEVKYIKRKAEHGVNAQYIQTSNHMGTHLDAPRHFVTNGRTIDEIPMEWLCGPGVIVDLRTRWTSWRCTLPKMIEKRVKVRKGDLLYPAYRLPPVPQFGAKPTRSTTSTCIPARTPTWCPGCSRRGSISGEWIASRPTTR